MEGEYARLKAELEAGRATADEFQQTLQGLVLDVGGHYWMIGAESGRWYRSEGDRWIEAQAPQVRQVVVEQPAAVAASGVAVPGAARTAGLYSPAGPRNASRWVLGAGAGCLAPLFALGSAASIIYRMVEGGSSVHFSSLLFTAAVFFALASVIGTRRIPSIAVCLIVSILWLAIGWLLTRVHAFPWVLSLAMFYSSIAAFFATLAGAGIRALLPRHFET